MTRLPLPLTFKAPKGLFKYTNYTSGDPHMFAGPYELEMMDGKSALSREWGFPKEIITYGLGFIPLRWLTTNKIPFSLERLDEPDDTGSIMFIHLPDEAIAEQFEELFCKAPTTNQ